jgi:hypothetical protein
MHTAAGLSYKNLLLFVIKSTSQKVAKLLIFYCKAHKYLPLEANARALSSSRILVWGAINEASEAGMLKAVASKLCTEDTNAPNFEDTRPLLLA